MVYDGTLVQVTGGTERFVRLEEDQGLQCPETCWRLEVSISKHLPSHTPGEIVGKTHARRRGGFAAVAAAAAAAATACAAGFRIEGCGADGNHGYQQDDGSRVRIEGGTVENRKLVAKVLPV